MNDIRPVMVWALAVLLAAACTYRNEDYEQGDVLCSNGIDDDGDGLVDCDDPSCADASVCQGGDADTDADTDTDTDTDADTDTDTDTDADTDTGSDTGSDTGTGSVPLLDDGEPCLESDECDSGHCDNGYCCGSGRCCATSADCEGDGEMPVCHGQDFRCVGCHLADVDEDAACAAAWPLAPFCDATDGMCVECAQHGHCREGAAPPWNSPVGVCALDRTCTCWTNATATWTCTATSQCPSGYQCARDFEQGALTHAVCLRSCEAEQAVANGMVCEARPTDGSFPYVWAPMTTCYAFSKFGEDCSGNSAVCSVDGAGGLEDGTCINDICTYSCWDGASQDTWCPQSVTCGTTPPYNGLCVP